MLKNLLLPKVDVPGQPQTSFDVVYGCQNICVCLFFWKGKIVWSSNNIISAQKDKSGHIN